MTAGATVTVQDVEARVDKLTQALFHVAGELWVMRDRQLVLERCLAESGVSAATAIDAYKPDAALTEKLAAERDAFVSNIVAILAPDI